MIVDITYYSVTIVSGIGPVHVTPGFARATPIPTSAGASVGIVAVVPVTAVSGEVEAVGGSQNVQPPSPSGTEATLTGESTGAQSSQTSPGPGHSGALFSARINSYSLGIASLMIFIYIAMI